MHRTWRRWGRTPIAIDERAASRWRYRPAQVHRAYVALARCGDYLSAAGKLSDQRPLSCAIAAISVGVVDVEVRVDLPTRQTPRRGEMKV